MELLGLVKHFGGHSPLNVAVQRDLQWLGNSTQDLSALKVLNALSRCLDLSEHGGMRYDIARIVSTRTLIARVRIVAITSSEPPRTRLSSRVGSYSQMAVAFLTATIFVICPITSMFPRLMTYPKHLLSKWKLERKRSNN